MDVATGSGLAHPPPDSLIYRVTGVHDPDWFFSSGETSVRDIEEALATVNRSLRDFSGILDFGCGCGRILSWMVKKVPAERLCGVDLDAEAIEWLRSNLAGVELRASGHNPPLPFEDGHFDLVYCHSVFTHLDTDYQDAWLEELHRVTAPESILVVSFSGQHAFAKMEETWIAAGASPAKLRESLLADGHLFIEDDEWKGGPFPDFYHSMFHTASYVYQHWGRLFRVLAHIPQGSLGFQDFVVLQHPGESFVAAKREETPSILPFPPESLRMLVGHRDTLFFDNPTGALVFPEIPQYLYESVFDFGCGCGRIARQLLQQQVRPRRYVGIDIHRGMIDWCNEYLTPADPNFQFLHHDVYNPGLAPQNTSTALPYPVTDRSFTLVNAHSVFTHLYKEQTEFYLREISRILTPGGMARTTWFFFDRVTLPWLEEFQVCLYVNEIDPTNAVIYDRKWFLSAVQSAGLAVLNAIPPAVRGHQWQIFLGLRDEGSTDNFPLDGEPIGLIADPPADCSSAHEPNEIPDQPVDLETENQELKTLVAELTLRIRRLEKSSAAGKKQ